MGPPPAVCYAEDDGAGVFMKRTSSVGAGPMKSRDADASAKDAVRISAPDGDGNRFIIAPEVDAGDGPPPPDATGRFAPEGGA